MHKKQCIIERYLDELKIDSKKYIATFILQLLNVQILKNSFENCTFRH